MSYLHYRIDVCSLSESARCTVWDFLSNCTDIHSSDFSCPGVYEAFFREEDVSILKNPVFNGCEITDITQSGM